MRDNINHPKYHTNASCLSLDLYEFHNMGIGPSTEFFVVEEPVSWTCKYCLGANLRETRFCDGCGAPKRLVE